MKTLPFLSAGLLSAAALLTVSPLLTRPAAASCVDTDVNLQLAIRDQNAAPTQQSNGVNSQIEDGCFGQTATGVNNQIYFGGADQVVQTRERDVYMAPGEDSYAPGSEYYGDLPDVQTHVNIQRDIAIPMYGNTQQGGWGW
jgi:hypothetical protein